MKTKTIWKFELASTIDMPEGAEILSVQNQNTGLVIWALVDPENKMQKRSFEVFGTGHPIQNSETLQRKYIGTVQDLYGSLVYHIFEEIN